MRLWPDWEEHGGVKDYSWLMDEDEDAFNKIGNIQGEQNLRRKVIGYEARCGNQDMSKQVPEDLDWSSRGRGDLLGGLYSLA